VIQTPQVCFDQRLAARQTFIRTLTVRNNDKINGISKTRIWTGILDDLVIPDHHVPTQEIRLAGDPEIAR
jgi:hypothetical protein